MTIVKLETGEEKQIAGLGLEPLNKILVNVCLSPDEYGKRKQLRNPNVLLAPEPCGSMRMAAYKFQPEITISPPVAATYPRRGGVVANGTRQGGTIKEATVDPEKLIAGGSNKQKVPYWLHCAAESDLPKRFTPNQIVLRMRPEDPSEDRLGVLHRLRILSATHDGLVKRMVNGEWAPPVDRTQLQSALSLEKDRLRQALRLCREKVLKSLSPHKTPDLALSEEDLQAKVRTLRNDDVVLYRNLDYRHELTRVSARLAAE